MVWLVLFFFGFGISAISAFSLARTPVPGAEWSAAQQCEIVYSKTGMPQKFGSLWNEDETAILICLRSFGWFFCQELARQIAKDIIPVIGNNEKSSKLICVGIGTHERSLEFSNLTNFPKDYLYSDKDNQVYDALGLVKSTYTTLFTDKRTPLSILKRFQKGESAYLQEALKTWKPWIPPKLEQGFQQGGAYVFNGRETIYGRKDPATGDHADLNKILEFALQSK